jgi:hypothetical protein
MPAQSPRTVTTDEKKMRMLPSLAVNGAVTLEELMPLQLDPA